MRHSFPLLILLSIPVVLCDKYEGDMLVFGFIPKVYLDFINDLSESEIEELGDLKMNVFDEDIKKTTDRIRPENADLADKVEKFNSAIWDKLNELSEGAKDFVVDTMKSMMAVHDLTPDKAECFKRCMIVLLGHIKDAKKMPVGVMAEIGTVFPDIKDYWEDQKVKEFLKKNLSKDPRKVVEALEPSDVSSGQRVSMVFGCAVVSLILWWS
ncbi:hypothetical protein QR680_015845 [Steinernema hermaphroditum]|uniref:Fatty-acid and retinol-binding protein 1 n=1 Tax=Steinernema hermaphroditum TaxID=289476 RepID=A0AA39H955_9BILA|nr:hypothetical protein QR680_015845 [Steinernema hermaphroditum]